MRSTFIKNYVQLFYVRSKRSTLFDFINTVTQTVALEKKKNTQKQKKKKATGDE